jgi:hypothetical protein
MESPAQPPAPGSRSISWRTFTCALITLIYFVYFNRHNLGVQFASDDFMNIYGTWQHSFWRNLYDMISPWRGAYRPMAACFYLPLLRCFGLNPYPFHVALLALHLVNLGLLYRLARRIGTERIPAWIATLVVSYHVGLSWLYYNTAYIYDILAFTFFLASFLVYARARERGTAWRWRDFAAVLAFYLAALDSKEMAVTLPAILLAYEWFFRRAEFPSPRTFASWLRGPGRVIVACTVLTLLYAYGKIWGPDPLVNAGGYKVGLSIGRLFRFEKAAMDDLFLTWGTFAWKGVVAVWLGTAYLAWRRPRPAMRFLWVWLMVTPLPLSVLEGRSGACLYIPVAAWSIFGAVVLLDVARAVGRFLSGEPPLRRVPQSVFVALVLAFAFYRWAERINRLQVNFVRPAMAQVGGRHAEVIAQLRKLNPRVAPHSRVLFLHDPLPDWDMVFVAQLWFHDRTLNVYSQNRTPIPENERSGMRVFDFHDGRFIDVTGAGSPHP